MCLRWPSQVCTVPGERCNDRRESNWWSWLLRNEFHGLANARRAFSKSLRNAIPNAGSKKTSVTQPPAIAIVVIQLEIAFLATIRPDIDRNNGLCVSWRTAIYLEKTIFPPIRNVLRGPNESQTNFARCIWKSWYLARDKVDRSSVADVKHSSFDTTNEAYCRGRRVSLSRQESDDLVEPHKNTCLMHLYHAMCCIVHQLFHHVCCPLCNAVTWLVPDQEA